MMKKVLFYVVTVTLLSGFPVRAEDLNADEAQAVPADLTATAARCIEAGYKLTSCESNRQLTSPCPYDQAYYRYCDCKKVFRYTPEECTKMGWQTSAEACDDKHFCF
jgi:hypothetical protein